VLVRLVTTLVSISLRVRFYLDLGFTFYVYYISTKPNCTLLVRYCHVTGGVLIRFQIPSSAVASIVTSFQQCHPGLKSVEVVGEISCVQRIITRDMREKSLAHDVSA